MPKSSKQASLKREMNSLSNRFAKLSANSKKTKKSKSKSSKTRRNRKLRSSLGPLNKKENEYLESLIAPELFPGAKVPDLCSFPTGTFQLTKDLILTSPAVGDCAGVFNIGGIAAGNGPYTFSNAAVGGAITVATSDWSSSAAIQAAYGQFRPVSQEIYAEFIGSSFADQGYLVTFLLPDNTGLSGNTPTGILALPYTRTYPLREGCRITWKPQDNRDFEFLGIASAFGGPNFGFAVVGAVASTAVLKVRFVSNYEGTPKSDQSTLVNASPSPTDLGLLSKAMDYGKDIYSSFSSFASSIPNLGISTENVISSVRNLANGVNTVRSIQSAMRGGGNMPFTLGNARQPVPTIRDV